MIHWEHHSSLLQCTLHLVGLFSPQTLKWGCPASQGFLWDFCSEPVLSVGNYISLHWWDCIATQSEVNGTVILKLSYVTQRLGCFTFNICYEGHNTHLTMVSCNLDSWSIWYLTFSIIRGGSEAYISFHLFFLLGGELWLISPCAKVPLYRLR